MKKSILNLGKVLNKSELKTISGKADKVRVCGIFDECHDLSRCEGIPEHCQQ